VKTHPIEKGKNRVYKLCLLRIMKISESSLFRESNVSAWEILRKEGKVDIYGAIYWREGKIKGYDFVIEFYKDEIWRYVNSEFPKQTWTKLVELRNMTKAEKLAYVMLEEFGHLNALKHGRPVKVKLEGELNFD